MANGDLYSQSTCFQCLQSNECTKAKSGGLIYKVDCDQTACVCAIGSTCTVEGDPGPSTEIRREPAVWPSKMFEPIVNEKLIIEIKESSPSLGKLLEGFSRIAHRDRDFLSTVVRGKWASGKIECRDQAFETSVLDWRLSILEERDRSIWSFTLENGSCPGDPSPYNKLDLEVATDPSKEIAKDSIKWRLN